MDSTVWILSINTIKELNCEWEKTYFPPNFPSAYIPVLLFMFNIKLFFSLIWFAILYGNFWFFAVCVSLMLKFMDRIYQGDEMNVIFTCCECCSVVPNWVLSLNQITCGGGSACTIQISWASNPSPVWINGCSTSISGASGKHSNNKH